MADFITKDSGEREGFDSGARRDTQAGKPRYDQIPPGPLKRLAELYARGAEKYGDSNWEKGMPVTRILASLMRHLEQYRLGEADEDHLAAVVWNAFAIMHFQGTKWDDLRDWNTHAQMGGHGDTGRAETVGDGYQADPHEAQGPP